MTPLKIAFLSPELAPFAKVGGLGDVAAALPLALHRAGHDVQLFVPLFGRIDTGAHDFQSVQALGEVHLDFGGTVLPFSLARAALPGSDLQVNFVHSPTLFGRHDIYTNDADEHLRWLMLQRAALESCRRLAWAPDILHCNDWQTALTPLLLKCQYGWDPALASTRSVLGLHNLGHQGSFSASILPQLNLGNDARYLHQDDLNSGQINFLKTGILYADMLATVSPTYAQEIQTESFGFDLDELLRNRGEALVGILNGVDYDEWNPRTDPHLPMRYSEKSLWRKRRCKELLLSQLRLEHRPERPLLTVVTRLAAQKGLELMFEVLPEALEHRDVSFVVLGTGEARYEEFFQQLQQRFPTRVCFHNGYSEAMAHLLEGAGDIFLMPSRYEPCGLNQMYSLKYGTVPVVRKTGGLADTVQHFDPHTRQGTGFVFEHFTAQGLRWALNTALDCYTDQDAWRQLMLNGMAQDYSWDKQVQEYEVLYRQLAAEAKQSATEG